MEKKEIEDSAKFPLVTIVVCTYNSGEFILEALESVKAQTFSNIELIITDDGSQDDTVQKVKAWTGYAINSQRFLRIKVLESATNTGTSANVNRGLYASWGEWIIFLAGDDSLKPACVEANVRWITSNPQIKVLFSKVDVYRYNLEPHSFIYSTPGDPYNKCGILAPGRSAWSQHKMLLLCDRIHFTPSLFINRNTLISVKGFDERFKLYEDYPLWLKLTQAGHRLYFMDETTVNYRQHQGACNNKFSDYLINPNYFKMEYLRRKCTYPFLPFDIRLNQRMTYFISLLFKNGLLSRNSRHNRVLLDLLTVYLNPIKYFIWLKKKVLINLRQDEFYM